MGKSPFSRDSSRDAVGAENAALHEKVEMLREMLDDKKEQILALRDQVRVLQEALVSKESPDAWREQKWQEAQAEAEQTEYTPEQIKQFELRAAQTAMERDHLENIEKPLFKDAEDMMSLLMGPIGAPESASLHGDNES